MKKSQNELEKVLKRLESGELKGGWEIRQIDEPDMKGFAIRGRFSAEEPLESLDPIEPLKPSKRRPRAELPIEIPKEALKEMREPLVDIYDSDGLIKVYIELPGVERSDIKLNFANDCIEVSARNFRKTIQLPSANILKDDVSTEYKNGVLQIAIAKAKRLRKEDEKNLRSV